jgi:V/A-type H+-transporting ATPase subunit I
MIVPMKKVHLLFRNGSDSEANRAIELLRQFGAFHFGLADESTSMLQQMEEALAVLEQHGDPRAQEFGAREKNADYYSSKTLRLRGERSGIQAELAQLEGVEDWYRQWGEVSLSAVRKIAECGRYLRLFEVAHAELAALDIAARDDLYTVGRDTKVTRLALITADADAELPGARPVALPVYELAELRNREARLRARLREIDEGLQRLTGRMHIISREISEERNRIRFNSVKRYVRPVEGIANVHHVQGYIPEDTVAEYEALAQRERWGYTVADPGPEDTPPTLLRNPRWVEPVYMLYRFLGLRIGYREMDISAVFMVFYTLFAGLLVADAGYGIVFLLLTAAAQSRLRAKTDPRYFQLGYALSASIIVCGALSGVWFGSVTIAALPGFRDVTIPAIAAFDIEAGTLSSDISGMMRLGFFLGIAHLVLAHLMKAWQTRGSTVMVGHVGYIAFLSAVYQIVTFLILRDPLPPYNTALLIGGAAMILLFLRSDRGFVAGMKSQAATFVFDIIGGFSDMISYIRLPIVGLVTVVLGALFNLLFLGAPLGHAFGMVLALMAVLIHATRLKSMEFSTHAGMEWNGDWYNPFAGEDKKPWI